MDLDDPLDPLLEPLSSRRHPIYQGNEEKNDTGVDSSNHNSENNEASSPPGTASSSRAVLLAGCTLTLISIGIAIVLFVALLPLITLFIFPSSLAVVSTSGLCLVGHVYALWRLPTYLAVFRTFALPIRRLLLPLVIAVARIESIREQAPTLYYAPAVENDPVASVAEQEEAEGEVNTNGSTGTVTASSPVFRKSVRRHYKRMQKIYQRHGIRHEAVLAETHLDLCQVMPILWQHETRVCAAASGDDGNNNNPVEEFIKRALVITLVPDGILDLYYWTPGDSDDQKEELCCFQFSILTGKVWHWFMYFCQDSTSRAGIWWHGALLALHRSHACLSHPIRYVNAQVHQTESKQHAGYVPAHPDTHEDLLEQIYPWSFGTRVPEQVRQVCIWDRNAGASVEGSSSGENRGRGENPS